jgi:hypothetical protein
LPRATSSPQTMTRGIRSVASRRRNSATARAPARRDDGPRIGRKSVKQRPGTRDRVHTRCVLGLPGSEVGCLAFNGEMRGQQADSLDRSPSMGGAKDGHRVEAMVVGPPAPGPLDALPRIDKYAVQIEQHGAARHRRHSVPRDTPRGRGSHNPRPRADRRPNSGQRLVASTLPACTLLR